MRADVGWMLAVAGKAALLLAASWLGAGLLRRSPAAARHQLWALGVAGALLMPLLCAVLPSLAVAVVPSTLAGRPELVGQGIAISGGRVANAAPTWPTWLALVWGTGTLIVIVRLLAGVRVARRLARGATPIDDAGPLDLRRSDAITSPMTVGVVHPRVLLPAAADGWSAERLRAVLVHERGHVQRRDILIQLGAQVACALYWWNPLTWLAAARLRLEREHACDDLVLAAGVRPSSYATDLLDVARAGAPTTGACVACMAAGSSTEHRLRRILDTSTPRRPRPRWAGPTLGVAALAVTAAVACTTAAPASPTPTPGTLAAITPGSAPSPVRGTIAIGSASATDMSRMAFDYRQHAGVPLPDDDLAVITSDLTVRLGDLTACYERRLRERPTLAGEISIHWTIQRDGSVPEQCISHDSVGDPAIATCVNELIKSTTFTPPVAGEVGVEFPFVFAPQR